MSLHPGVISLEPGETIETVLDACREELMAMGVVSGTYHLTPAFHSQLSSRTVVTHFGYADDMIGRYLEPETFANDPIPDHVMRVGRTMTWKQALRGRRLSREQRAFVRSFLASGLGHGFSVPLFGPNGRDSYAAFSLGHEISAADEPLITRIVEVALIAHRKVCVLAGAHLRKPVKLSAREEEVLYWMALSKSNAAIATILGISAATVDTHVRRIFAKLGVNDRISAVIEGLSHGLAKRR